MSDKASKAFHKSAGFASSVASNLKAVISKARSESQTRKSNKILKVIKFAKSFDNAPNFDERGNVTDAFKARSVAQGVIDEQRAKVAKDKKKMDK